MNERINVVIVDDLVQSRKGAALLLKDHNIHVTEEAVNGIDFFKQYKAGSISSDIILMDIKMPEMNGSEALDVVRKNYPWLKVIMMSQYYEEELIRDLLNRGACAYITKDTDPEEFARAIREVKQTGSYIKNLCQLFKAIPERYRNDKFKMLYTNREREIIVLVCQGKSVEEMIKDLNVSGKAVEAHLTEIYRKAGVKNRAKLLIYAIDNGLNYLGN